MGFWSAVLAVGNVGVKWATWLPVTAVNVVAKIATHPDGALVALTDTKKIVMDSIIQTNPLAGAIADLVDSHKLSYGPFPNRGNWMGSTHMGPKRIDQMVLPGTHDSGTFDLSRRSSPDAPSIVANLTKIPLTVDRISGWAKTQYFDFVGQLDLGVRYFDLRVGVSSYDQSLRTFHALESNQTLREMFDTIKPWMDTHKSEIVILHVKRAMEFGGKPTKRDELINTFKAVFGDLLVPRSFFSDKKVYNDYVASNRRVIVVFESNSDILPLGDAPDWIWKTDVCMSDDAPSTRKDTSSQIYFVWDLVSTPNENPSTVTDYTEFATLDNLSWGAGRRNKDAVKNLSGLPLPGKGWIIPLDFPEVPNPAARDYIIGLNGTF